MGVVFNIARKLTNKQASFLCNGQWVSDLIRLIVLQTVLDNGAKLRGDCSAPDPTTEAQLKGISLDFLLFSSISCDKYCMSQQHRERRLILSQ